MTLLSDPDPKVGSDAANACILLPAGSAPSSLVEALVRAASDVDPELRAQAVLALGSLRAADGRELFLRALSDEDWLVRMFAATAIGWMPDPRAIRSLEELLADDEPLVRGAAVSALGKMGDAAVIVTIDALLQTERDRDVRESAKEALEKLHGGGASAER